MCFAEKIIESMVDENGFCGERGISAKQFYILIDSGLANLVNRSNCGCWSGDYKTIHFELIDYVARIGRYEVSFHEHSHFNSAYVIDSIKPVMTVEEYEAIKEAEVARKKLLSFEDSTYVGSIKDRITIEATLVNETSFERAAYTYGYETVFVYTFADKNGNNFTWFTTSVFGHDNEEGTFVPAKVGDSLKIKATIKDHKEYRGIKQNVVNRVTIVKK